MRKEYYNYVVKLPVLLHELFRGKVADYHFSDMTVVMNHLVKSYIRMTDGGRVSTATRRILLCMDRIPDMSFFFRRQEKAVLFFEMDPAVADSLQRAIVSGGWGNRQRLAVRLVCAFCCGAGVTLNNLSMELAAGEVFRRPEGYLIHSPGRTPEDSPSEAFRGTAPDAAAGHQYGRLGQGERFLPGQPYRWYGVP